MAMAIRLLYPNNNNWLKQVGTPDVTIRSSQKPCPGRYVFVSLYQYCHQSLKCLRAKQKQLAICVVKQ